MLTGCDPQSDRMLASAVCMHARVSIRGRRMPSGTSRCASACSWRYSNTAIRLRDDLPQCPPSAKSRHQRRPARLGYGRGPGVLGPVPSWLRRPRRHMLSRAPCVFRRSDRRLTPGLAAASTFGPFRTITFRCPHRRYLAAMPERLTDLARQRSSDAIRLGADQSPSLCAFRCNPGRSTS